jgi:syntaxin 16
MFKFNQFTSDVLDRKKISNDSSGEILDKSGSKNFLKTNNSDSDSDSTTDSSKASYLEKYEACNKIMTTLETNFSLLQKEQQKRLIITFDEEENNKLNKSIGKIVHGITTQLQLYERTLKDLMKLNLENNIHNIIKSNLQQALVEKVKEYTRKFKLNQELYTKKYKELVGEDDPTIEINTFMKEEENNQKDNFLMVDNSHQMLKKRDTELNQLLNSVQDLAGIFKDMQSLVMEQGSILDRIDYNIDIASTNVVKGKNSLIKANEYHKNNCFRNIIIVLLVCIFIEAFMLIFKFIK